MNIISYEKFVEKYKPIQNTSTHEGSYDNTAFETYGKDLEVVDEVLKVTPNNIWTLIDCDNEESWIIPGFHFVNRSLYFISENPWTEEDKNTLEINNNEMINIDEAIKHCIEFFKSINVDLDKEEVSVYYRNEEPLYTDMFTVGRSKYIAIEFYEEKFEEELSEENQDKIHDWYSQL
jgi:hypothetical protein